MITADSGQVRTKAFAFQDPELQATLQLRLAISDAGSGRRAGAGPACPAERLRARRQQIWALYAEAVQDCSYFKPQRTPPGYVNACWTFAARYEGDRAMGVSWHDFAAKFRELSGEGVYAAWSVVYLEPVMAEQRFYGHGCPIHCPHRQTKVEWKKGLCPTAEAVQPTLMQFKANIGDLDEARRQADALRRTIEFFGEQELGNGDSSSQMSKKGLARIPKQLSAFGLLLGFRPSPVIRLPTFVILFAFRLSSSAFASNFLAFPANRNQARQGAYADFRQQTQRHGPQKTDALRAGELFPVADRDHDRQSAGGAQHRAETAGPGHEHGQEEQGRPAGP